MTHHHPKHPEKSDAERAGFWILMAALIVMGLWLSALALLPRHTHHREVASVQPPVIEMPAETPAPEMLPPAERTEAPAPDATPLAQEIEKIEEKIEHKIEEIEDRTGEPPVILEPRNEYNEVPPIIELPPLPVPPRLRHHWVIPHHHHARPAAPAPLPVDTERYPPRDPTYGLYGGGG